MTGIDLAAKAGSLGFKTYANPPWGLANPVPSIVVHLTFRWSYCTPSTSLPSLGVAFRIRHMVARDPAERPLCVAGESPVKEIWK